MPAIAIDAYTVTTDGVIQIMDKEGGSPTLILMEPVTTQTHGVDAHQCASQIIKSRIHDIYPSLLQDLRSSLTPCQFCNATCLRMIPQLNICEVDTHQYTFHVIMCPICMCINCENQAMAAMEHMATLVQHLFAPEASTQPDTTTAEEYHGQGNQSGRACMDAILSTPY